MHSNQEAMVLQNSRDKVLTELRNVNQKQLDDRKKISVAVREKRQKELEYEKERKIESAKESFCGCFFELIRSFYGLLECQAKKKFCTDRGCLLEFEKIIAKKAVSVIAVPCVIVAASIFGLGYGVVKESGSITGLSALIFSAWFYLLAKNHSKGILYLCDRLRLKKAYGENFIEHVDFVSWVKKEEPKEPSSETRLQREMYNG